MKKYGILRDGEMFPSVESEIKEAENHAYILKHLIGYEDVQIIEIVECNKEPVRSDGKERSEG